MRRRIAAVLLLASTVAAVAVPAALAVRNKPPPKPTPLWREYPIGTARVPTTKGTHATRPRPAATVPQPTATVPQPTATVPQPTAPQPTAPPPTATTPAAKHPSPPPSLALVLVTTLTAAVALVGLAAFFLLRMPRRGVSPVAPELAAWRTIEAASTRLKRRRLARGIEDEPRAWDKFTSNRRRGDVTEQLDDRIDAAGAGGVEVQRTSHADLGGRVAELIKAAEVLADQIRGDAREEAAEIKRQAEEAAAAALQRATLEEQELRANAEAYASDIRRTGESYASDRRREAEAEAAELIAEGEGQARAMREAAEQMSLRIEATALRRRDELEERSGAIEERLRRFHTGLRALTRDVDELLGQRPAQPEGIVEALEVRQPQPAAQRHSG